MRTKVILLVFLCNMVTNLLAAIDDVVFLNMYRKMEFREFQKRTFWLVTTMMRERNLEKMERRKI